MLGIGPSFPPPPLANWKTNLHKKQDDWKTNLHKKQDETTVKHLCVVNDSAECFEVEKALLVSGNN